jgi:L-alanine-DL-glutamate epimerase-like enolase superfamily enzyme
MDRRSFIQFAGAMGVLALCSRLSVARKIIVVDSGEPVVVSRIEWVLYDANAAQDGKTDHRCALRITATNGAQGYADLSQAVMPTDEITQLIRATVLGRDPADRDVIWRELYGLNLPLGTLSAVDIALWDLYGRIEAKPVHALIGAQRDKVKASVSTGFNLGDAEAYAEFAVACKERNVHAVKVQPYVTWDDAGDLVLAGFADKDMATYQAVRVAVGADYPCIADNHGSYSFDEALRVGRLLDNLNYEWYQSPMPETDAWIDQYARLAGEVRVPICAPQSYPDSYESRIAWVNKGACDIACIDALLGGFTACYQLALACRQAEVPLELSHIGLDSYPHLQLIGAMPESLIQYVEMPPLSQEAYTHPGRTTPEPVIDDDGYVTIPQTPGMGVDLDWQNIVSHRVD